MDYCPWTGLLSSNQTSSFSHGHPRLRHWDTYRHIVVLSGSPLLNFSALSFNPWTIHVDTLITDFIGTTSNCCRLLSIYADRGLHELPSNEFEVRKGCRMKTRGQSNLAKAASNALHTLHALDSRTTAIPKICRGSQKLQVGHVTQTRTRIWPTVA